MSKLLAGGGEGAFGEGAGDTDSGGAIAQKGGEVMGEGAPLSVSYCTRRRAGDSFDVPGLPMYFFLCFFWRKHSSRAAPGPRTPTHHAGAHASTRTLRTLTARYPNTRDQGESAGNPQRRDALRKQSTCESHPGDATPSPLVRRAGRQDARPANVRPGRTTQA